MATPLDKVDLDHRTSAEVAFTSGSGRVGPQFEPSAAPADATVEERKRLMTEFSIQYDGRRYRWNGYHYDRLADAVAYARLMRSRRPQERHTASSPHGAAADLPSQSPTEADRQLMAALSISFEAGVYVFRGFRYDRLADAAGYAALCRSKQPLEGAR